MPCAKDTEQLKSEESRATNLAGDAGVEILPLSGCVALGS